MEQLPGLASQHLMSQGYGYGGEGDWKVAALTRIVKGLTEAAGRIGFMEDYTYDLEPGNELFLGAHMLEVCPSLAGDRPRIEVHPLGIGGKSDPARLVFFWGGRPGLLISLIDMGGRFRLILHEVEAFSPSTRCPICRSPGLCGSRNRT